MALVDVQELLPHVPQWPSKQTKGHELVEAHQSHTNISGGRLRVHVEGVRMALRRATEGVEARDARRQRDDVHVNRSERVRIVVDFWVVHDVGLLDGSRVATEHE